MANRDWPRTEPLPARLTVREALDVYLTENGFTVDGYADTTVKLSFYRLHFTVPNPATRRRAVPFHDLHHLVTGYGTDIPGEAEVSAWEMRRGFRNLGIYPSLLVTSAVALGFVVAPRRTLRALRRGRGSRSLFRYDHPYESLLGMTLGDLRTLLGVPKDGIAVAPRKTHPLAPEHARTA